MISYQDCLWRKRLHGEASVRLRISTIHDMPMPCATAILLLGMYK